MSSRPQAPFKKRTDGEGRSLAELFSEAREGLRSMERLMETRRNPDKAATLLTDTFTTVQEIAQRFAGMRREFDGRPVAVGEEDDETERDREREHVGMADLFPADLSAAEEELDEVMIARVEDYHRAYRSIEGVRAQHYRDFIDFAARGARQWKDVTANLLALARRVRPESLATLGMGQSEVARKLGETRATTSAREKRTVERPLKANGTKGYHMLGGTKSEAHRAKCRQSQEGNKNRATAHALKQAAQATTTAN